MICEGRCGGVNEGGKEEARSGAKSGFGRPLAIKGLRVSIEHKMLMLDGSGGKEGSGTE